MGRDEVIEKLKQICSSYADILGIVILFGSYSRNEATTDSDIDLYDSFPTDFDLLAYGGKRDLQSVRRSPLWKQINEDGIVIYDQRAKAI